MSAGPWKRLGSRPIADCRVFKVLSESFRSPRTGQDHEFFVLSSADWVNVVALTDAGEMLLVRQFRFGRQQMSLEIPGGMVDPGESPIEAARRELLEETGYSPRRIEPLGVIDSNSAILDNLTHTFLATGCEQSAAQHLDSTEDLDLVKVQASRIDELLRSGEVRHPLVSVALHHWKLRGSPMR
jgi:8-oxo-dGTP pyrophosphatase MutT (NUDIX family)